MGGHLLGGKGEGVEVRREVDGVEEGGMQRTDGGGG
jgi:hypothetical protein